MMNDSPWIDDDSDQPLEHDLDDSDPFGDDSSELIECPFCNAEIYEESVRCPVCGTYVSDNSPVFSGRPMWWILLGLAGIAADMSMLAVGT